MMGTHFFTVSQNNVVAVIFQSIHSHLFSYGFRNDDFGEDDQEESVESRISSAFNRVKYCVTMGTPFVTAVKIFIAK
jgi:hypothetical protein